MKAFTSLNESLHALPPVGDGSWDAKLKTTPSMRQMVTQFRELVVNYKQAMSRTSSYFDDGIGEEFRVIEVIVNEVREDLRAQGQ